MNEKAKCKNCTDKMIEEMAFDLIKATSPLGVKDLTEVFNYEKVATDLCNLWNWRKILEGSVVLDRQEYQKYCAYKIIEPQIKGCLDRERELEKQVAELEEQRDRQAYIAEELIQEKHRWTEQARKETAKEIAKTIKSVIWEEFENETIRIKDLHGVIDDIVSSKFGVEVEE